MRFFELESRAARRLPADWRNIVKTIQMKLADRLLTGRGHAAGWLKLALVTGFGLLASLAVAQPANDFFANASVITGLSGTTNGSNVGASLEGCETNLVNCDDDGQQYVDNSIWYAWTAPVTGTVEFDTAGSGFDTVLSIWTTTNGLCDASLTNLISDDDTAFNNGLDLFNFTSYLTFPAVAGTTYYISVNGNALDFGDDSNNVVLHWVQAGAVVPTIPSGTFQLTKTLYVCSETDSAGPQSPSVSAWSDAQGNTGARVTVTRVGGSSGRVLVDYNTVTQYYTNYYNTNYFGTNFSYTVIDTNGVGSTSNSVLNFIVYTNYSYQIDANGNYVYVLGASGALTNLSIQIFNQITTNYTGTNYPVVTHRMVPLPTNLPPVTNYYLLPTNPVVIVGISTNQAITNIFSSAVTNQFSGVVFTNGTTYFDGLNNYTNFANYWTNTFVTNYYGTNISIAYFPLGVAQFFTNYYITNIVVSEWTYTNMVYTNGLLGINFVFTNSQILSGTTNFTWSTSNNVGQIVSTTSANGAFTPVPSPLPPLGTRSLGSGSSVDASGDIIITNLYTYRYQNVLLKTNSASLAFTAVAGTLIFDDYQMSQDILVPVRQVATPQSGSWIGIQLNNARLDSLESADLEAPTVDPINGVGTVKAVNPAYSSLFPADPALFNIERSTFRVDKDIPGYATVTVFRTGNLGDSVSVDYTIDPSCGLFGGNNPAPATFTGGYCPANQFTLEAGSDYATPNSDYTPVSGTLSWGIGDTSPRSITIPILNNGLVENNEDFLIQLYNPLPEPSSTDIGAQLGQVNNANVTILFDDVVCGQQPAGAVDRCWNSEGSDVSVPPFLTYPGTQGGVSGGANGNGGTVYAIAEQTDGKAIFAGSFISYDDDQYNRIVRVSNNGYVDTTFQGLAANNNGANDYITALAIQPDGQILIGGKFTSFNGANRYHVARLNTDGSVDNTFLNGTNGTGLGVRGTNAMVWSLALQSNGQVVIAGNFSSVNGTNCNSVARLNADGTLDTSFNPGIGPDGTINSVVVDSLGRVIIGGAFENVAGVLRGGVARLNVDGSLDTTFNPGIGTYNPDTGYTDPVYALALQPDGNLLVGGAISYYQLQNYNGIVRLTTDGSVDTSFNPGSGPYNGTYNPVTGVADTVSAITLQPDGGILIGGDFTTFNQTRRVGLARLFQWGSLDTSFMDVYYNQFAGVPNHYHNPDAVSTTLYPSLYPPQNNRNFIDAIALEPGTTNVMIGGGFLRVGGGATREDSHPRSNVARVIGGATPGPGNIELSYNKYTVDKSGASLFVSMVRTNGSLGLTAVTFTTNMAAPGPGVASVTNFSLPVNPTVSTWPNLWFLSPSDSWLVSPAIYGPSYHPVPVDDVQDPGITLTINNNANNSGNVNANFGLTLPAGTNFFLGGELIPLGAALGWQDAAQMTIIDDNFKPGVLGFSSTFYTVNENGGTATITVVRTNFTGGVVQVSYRTLNGSATNGIDYTTNSGTLTFQAGDSSKTFTVPITKITSQQPDKTVNLMLYTPAGGATVGLTNAVLTIVNNNSKSGHIGFVSATYTANETDGTALIGIGRLGAALGTINVTMFTSDGTATNGVNYVGSTNVLTWTNGDVSTKTISIPVKHDWLYTSNLTVNLWLTNGVLNQVTNNAMVLGYGGTNAVLTIVNVDFPGTVEFASSAYSVKQYGGSALIPVVRTGGSAGTLAVSYTTMDGTALAGTNYTGTSGTLTFTNGQVAEYFNVPITAGATNGFVSLNLALTNAVLVGNPTAWNGLGSPSNAVLNIIDTSAVNEIPGSPDVTYNSFAGFDGPVYALTLEPNNQLLAGGDFTFADGVRRTRIARLNSDGSLDPAFSLPTSAMGADNSVRALAVQTDGRILVGGYFTNMNSVVMNGIARLNSDGSLDSLFNPGSGAANSVNAVGETFVNGDRKILVGGGFTLLNGQIANNIGRLNDDGSPDTSFNASGLGANATVYALAVQSDGKVVIGGDFTAVNGINVNHIARLNVDGSVDSSFTNASASDSVRAITLQLDGRILIGGLFTSVNGNTNFNHIARLNSADGSSDSSFTPGLGASDAVFSIALQTDNRIVLGGSFIRCSGVTRNRITRLNPDGTVDPTINFGAGADSFVAAVVVQEDTISGYPTNVPDEKIIIGGGFLNYFGASHPYLARIYGGSIGGSGAFEFSSATYSVNETGTNIVITVNRTGGTSGTNANGSGDIYVPFATSDGTALANTDHGAVTNYFTVVTNLDFPMGEVQQTITISVLDDQVITPDLTVNLAVNPVAPAAYGDQSTAVLTIVNNDSSISFSAATYLATKYAASVPNGFAPIYVNRNGATYGAASVIFNTTTNGSATPGVDYLPQTNVLVSFAPGSSVQTVFIPILNGISDGDQTVNLQLTNAIGSTMYSPSNAVLTILDRTQAKGSFVLSATNYVVSEGGGAGSINAYITVLRTNGASGIVTVTCSTSDGTAVAGSKYASTITNLTFGDGEMSKTFAVAVFNTASIEPTEYFYVGMSNPTGGASLGSPTNATVTILNTNTGIMFAMATNTFSETIPFATINVLRYNNTAGTTTVNYSTTNGTAVAGTNFVASSGTLTFNDGASQAAILVPLIYDTNVTGTLQFTLGLSSPSAGVQVAAPGMTTVLLLDADTGLSFTNANVSVLKNAGSLVVTVVCSNTNVEPVSVNYATADGTAKAGTDYSATSGTLTFSNGVATQTFTVPIINNGAVTGNHAFTISLSNPTGTGRLVSPSQQTVTIVDSNSGLRFSSANYTVLKSGGAAVITVYRSDYTDTVSSVNFLATNGTAVNGLNFVSTNGTLVFSNGVTSLTFSVPIIATTTVQPDLTVLLELSSPTNGILLSPSAATLTIHDTSGSFVIPAGSQMVTNYTSQLTDGVIYSNNTVTILFALRDAGGTNVSNLNATLLATNGVTPISPVTANYGPLIYAGHSVSRPFTFTAHGTNNQQIAATFTLQDGANTIGTAVFGYTLGSSSTVFSNSATIIINDTNAASPYPSIINVSGVGGSLIKATVTLNRLTHTSPHDVDALVVSPAQLNTLILAHAGGGHSVTNIVLTFDDAATNYLSNLGQITTSTNKPTQYFPVQNFP